MKRELIVALFFLAAVFLFAQEKKPKREKRIEKRAIMAEKVTGLVENRNFTFVARSANPTGWSEISLGPEYEFRVKGDSVFAYLPYYGRSYLVNYSSTDGGIKFNALTKDFTIKDRLTRFNINFEAQTSSDRYLIHLLVTKSGYGSLTVLSNNRQVINYCGVIEGLGL
jgi:hypothetical protein